MKPPLLTPEQTDKKPPVLPSELPKNGVFPKTSPPLPRPILPDIQPIDLKLMASLPSLKLRAKYLMEGFLTGLHRSPFKGFSVEFAEYRAYQPGDDLRRIDWRLFGRTDRLYLKQFEEDTQLKIYLGLDMSASMSYRGNSDRLTKLDYARTIIASLAFLMYRQRDAAGLALIGEKLEDYLRPRLSTAHLHSMIAKLDHPSLGKPSQLSTALHSLASLMSRRSMLVLASDFYEDPKSLTMALRRLRHDRHEIIGIQVFDPVEIDFNLEVQGTFVDLEGPNRVRLSTNDVRASYLKQFRAFQKETEEIFRDHGAEFIMLRTDQNPIPALASYLARRENIL